MGNQKKVAVVVGGATGIGQDITRHLAAEGYAIGILDSDAASGKQLQQELDAIFVEFDLSDASSAPAAMAKVAEKYGNFTALINATDTQVKGAAEDITVQDWDAMMNKDLKGAFFACQAAIPYMKENGGYIVNLSSIRSRIASGDHLLYAAAKAGISAITREMAADLWRYEIKCNAILYWADAQPDMILCDTLGPEDVCEAISFLISEGSYPINAFDFMLDGGMNIFRDKPTEPAYQ